MEFHRLPAHVREALESIRDGATADDMESEALEFKEDPHHHAKAKNPRASLFEKLIDECVCFANSDAASGFIVVGVADDRKGEAAFTGTDLDTEEAIRAVFNGTKPNLRVNADDFFFAESRLVLIKIPEALTLYTRTKGQASKRVGKSCQLLTEHERHGILATRANSDYSNKASQRSVDEIHLETVNEVKRLLREKRHRGGGDPSVPETRQALLRELGLIDDYGVLKRAGEILLLPVESPEVTIRHLWRPVPGSEPIATEFSAPLLVALPTVRRLIEERGGRELERVQHEDGQETVISHFPASAIDEVLSNAVIHRDWQASNAVIIEQSSSVLKVWSPGGLPPGVDRERLLTTQSIPRNNRLMAAMRALGLAEEQSRGFDRIWMAFSATGREVPEVRVGDDFVEVTLAAGEPDVEFVKALHNLENEVWQSSDDGGLTHNVHALLILWHLWAASIITMKKLQSLTQASRAEALETMEGLSSRDVVQRVRDAEEWTLGETARRIMNKRHGTDLAAVTIEEWIEAKLRDGERLLATEVAKQLGIDRKEAFAHLSHLRSLGRAMIDPGGPQRGKNTRWVAPR